MRINIVTLFPDFFARPLGLSIPGRAGKAGLVEYYVIDLRAYTHDRHQTVDDYPFGGGAGMVMKPEPMFEAGETVLGQTTGPDCPIILMTPQGRLFNQRVASELSAHERIALICGRYEGFDERIREHLATDEISIGDYVLTGGELPALVIIDAVTRLAPGALGDPGGAEDDSHALGLLEYPHYTRPPEFRGWRVPEVLLSGDHARIERWRREQSILRTLARRPDLLETADLTKEDRKLLEKISQEGNRDEAA
jgi:tRNA (guanine37-N1)-methyltransferase